MANFDKLLKFTTFALFASLGFVRSVRADDVSIYTDTALGAGWENWSWSSTIDFAATDLYTGSSGSSISVTSAEWAALSFRWGSSNFKGYAGLKFDIAGDKPDLSISIESVADGSKSPSIPLSAISTTITANKFTSVVIDFKGLPGSGSPLGDAAWDRINFQAGASGATYHIDNLVVVQELTVTPEFLSAEPLGNNVLAITTKGAVNLTSVSATLDGKKLSVARLETRSPVDAPAKTINYLHLASTLSPGKLVVTAGNKTWSSTLPAVGYASIVTAKNTPINPDIYGINFPADASHIKNLGIGISRWGGNAVTAYNPNGHFTNAGNDWYFENRVVDTGGADAWLKWVSGAGANTVLTVPALDWVAKDSSSYSYHRTVYPDQVRFDPYNTDAGNGKLANGSWVSHPPQTNAYTPWNTTLAKAWLKSLPVKPKIVNIDNEIEIAAETHQDMHPNPISFDEELKRVVDFATAAKEAIPDVKVAAPSTCSWWFYWTSQLNWDDNAAHNNMDFLPWFLSEMKKVQDKTGKRILDYLDVHYYYQADTSANDDAAKALRLRATRSLWDTGYVDESWVGKDPQNHQWSPDTVSLIPRLKTLINIYYPGTKLSVGEWSSNAPDTEPTGGLVTADSLGIFGRYGLDGATYWGTAGPQTPVGTAFWLFRGYGIYFGDKSAQVNFSNPRPDVLGLYATIGKPGPSAPATIAGKDVLSLVIINKAANETMAFDLANLPTGKYYLRHFGGLAGVAKWDTTIDVSSSQYVIVPPLTAVFLQQR